MLACFEFVFSELFFVCFCLFVCWGNVSVFARFFLSFSRE